MAILSTRYLSQALGGYVTFQAIIPFEHFGPDLLSPDPPPTPGRSL